MFKEPKYWGTISLLPIHHIIWISVHLFQVSSIKHFHLESLWTSWSGFCPGWVTTSNTTMAGPCSPWTTGPGPRGNRVYGSSWVESCANESLRQLCIQGGRSMVEILLGPVVPWVLLVMVSLMYQWGMHPWPWPRRQARVCSLGFFSPMKLVQDGPPYQLFP